ncbi:TraR/DksA C4-type zinc finger protein [Alkalicoccobacillus gibsonii]|uniref:TraR/DksA C4-type zinc finger protein n=1 Tax=Alkalicoccobacillus gibsonii TaxID=79881 RepID=A0ABU9VJ58_9BACI
MRDYSAIKTQLLSQQQHLKERLDGRTNGEKMEALSDNTGELSQYDNHPADAGTDLYEREKDMALHAHLREEYEEVRHAIEKIDKGTYGKCEVTGIEIPLERLEANPLARVADTKLNPMMPNYRPVEEDVLGGFDKYNYDRSDQETEFDSEDSYQSVERFNERDMTYEDTVSEEEDENRGTVEQYEQFASTDIYGYQGVESINIQHNQSYEEYSDQLDEQE